MTQINAHGILSLTKNCDDFNMWNLYANGHQGFLLEFKADFNRDPCMQGMEGEVCDVREVTYVKPYAFDVEELVNESDDIKIEVFNKRLLFYKKSIRWAKEDEWRMVRPLKDSPDWKDNGDAVELDRRLYTFDFRLNCIQSVTFGACMCPKTKDRIRELCQETDIQFFQAMILRDMFDPSGHQEIVKRYLIEPKHFDDVYGSRDYPMIFDFAGLQKAYRDPIQLTNISLLPYYKNNKKWIKQYIERNRNAIKA
jgi:hypothetical protein